MYWISTICISEWHFKISTVALHYLQQKYQKLFQIYYGNVRILHLDFLIYWRTPRGYVANIDGENTKKWFSHMHEMEKEEFNSEGKKASKWKNYITLDLNFPINKKRPCVANAG